MALRSTTDPKTEIRCAEVLSVDRRDSDNEVEVWYYLDRHQSTYNDFEMPLHKRRLVPEWYGQEDGMAYLNPSRIQIAGDVLVKRSMLILRNEVVILAPKWTLWPNGKVAEPTCIKLEKLMRSMASNDRDVRKVVRARYDRREVNSPVPCS